MGLRLLANPVHFAAVGLLCGVLGFRLGWRRGRPWALPLVQGVIGFAAFAVAWREGGAIVAAAAVGAWALGTTVVSVFVFGSERGHIDERVVGARAYRERRLAELARDASTRPRWRAMLSERVRVIVPFVVAAAATANLVSLVLGAALLNVVNAHAAALLPGAVRPWRARLLAWDAWHVVRGVSLVLIGSACAAPLAARLGRPDHAEHVLWLLAMGGLGLVLDLVLEALLGRAARRLLSGAVATGPRPGGN